MKVPIESLHGPKGSLLGRAQLGELKCPMSRMVDMNQMSLMGIDLAAIAVGGMRVLLQYSYDSSATGNLECTAISSWLLMDSSALIKPDC